MMKDVSFLGELWVHFSQHRRNVIHNVNKSPLYNSAVPRCSFSYRHPQVHLLFIDLHFHTILRQKEKEISSIKKAFRGAHGPTEAPLSSILYTDWPLPRWPACQRIRRRCLRSVVTPVFIDITLQTDDWLIRPEGTPENFKKLGKQSRIIDDLERSVHAPC